MQYSVFTANKLYRYHIAITPIKALEYFSPRSNISHLMSKI